ncbi:hypothetical protein ACLOJK_041777 [Asimina triloba]
MVTSALTQLSTGRRLFMSSSFSSFNSYDRAFSGHDLEVVQFSTSSIKCSVSAQMSTDFRSFPHDRGSQSTRALEEHVDASTSSTSGSRHQRSNLLEKCKSSDPKSSKGATILLQKSMLEKQWTFAFEPTELMATPDGGHKKIKIIRSGMSARQRRTKPSANKCFSKNSMASASRWKCPSYATGIDPASHSTGYMNRNISKDLLSHSEVEQLLENIKAGLSLEEQKLKLKERLGYEASDEQLASSLRISCAELRAQMIKCSLAREKLAMGNIRLVGSIARNYKNMGIEINDLIQGGLIALLRGIEKFDSSKGFKISTYLYWWIRQGISRAIVENSRILRLPPYLHERLILVRNAKTKLEEMGVTPSIEGAAQTKMTFALTVYKRIAESLNISKKKVSRAIEFIADNNLENNPWHKVDEWSLKREVNKLLGTTLCKRERDIISLYYGLNKECHTWEDIGILMQKPKCLKTLALEKHYVNTSGDDLACLMIMFYMYRIGLSRERVRQIGLAALEKLKNAAREQKMEAMLIKP